jgi:hypothetical protein
MAILDFEFTYLFEGIPPRKRSAVVACAVETFQFDVPEFGNKDLEGFTAAGYDGVRHEGLCYLPWRDPTWGLVAARVDEHGIFAADRNTKDRMAGHAYEMRHLVSQDPYDHILPGPMGAAQDTFKELIRSERDGRLADATRQAGDLIIVEGQIFCSRMRIVDLLLQSRSGREPNAYRPRLGTMTDARWESDMQIEGIYDPPPFHDMARTVLRLHEELIGYMAGQDFSGMGEELMHFDKLVCDLHSGDVDPEDFDQQATVIDALSAAMNRDGSKLGTKGDIDRAVERFSMLAEKRAQLAATPAVSHLAGRRV